MRQQLSVSFLPPVVGSISYFCEIYILLSIGAIYLDNGSGGKTLTVKGSVLYASTAGEQGGAIYMYSSNGAALITDNVFLDSSSTEVGDLRSAAYVASRVVLHVYSPFVSILYLAVSLLLFQVYKLVKLYVPICVGRGVWVPPAFRWSGR
jgi:hypothetical protein